MQCALTATREHTLLLRLVFMIKPKTRSAECPKTPTTAVFGGFVSFGLQQRYLHNNMCTVIMIIIALIIITTIIRSNRFLEIARLLHPGRNGRASLTRPAVGHITVVVIHTIYYYYNCTTTAVQTLVKT